MQGFFRSGNRVCFYFGEEQNSSRKEKAKASFLYGPMSKCILANEELTAQIGLSHETVGPLCNEPMCLLGEENHGLSLEMPCSTAMHPATWTPTPEAGAFAEYWEQTI